MFYLFSLGFFNLIKFKNITLDYILLNLSDEIFKAKMATDMGHFHIYVPN